MKYIKIYKEDSIIVNMKREEEKLKGLVGVIILFIILSIIYLLANLISILSLFRGVEFQDSLVFGIAWIIAVITNLIYLILIFRRSAKIKYTLFIGKTIEIASLIFLIYTIWNGPSVSLTTLAIHARALFGGIAQIILAILWIAYFARSKRVKNTFVR